MQNGQNLASSESHTGDSEEKELFIVGFRLEIQKNLSVLRLESLLGSLAILLRQIHPWKTLQKKKKIKAEI